LKTQSGRFLFKTVVPIFFFLLINANPVHSQLPRDIQWVSKSVEYAAVCVQTYRSAWRAVKEAAQFETRDWVVVLDVDETVLDNSQYAVERAEVDSGYTPESWAKWVFRKEASPIPGVKAFIDSVRTLGPRAHVAYITNRLFEHEKPTIENLRRFGLFKEGDIMLTKKGPGDTKEDRRRCLQNGTGRCKEHGPFVILALLGDNIRDFVPVRGLEQAKRLREKQIPEDPNWGVKYFMLPNPTYGAWERDYR
jgi:5'-nucleotidase (lipoprotein e(P4) family)